MEMTLRTLRVSVVCESCGATNEITASESSEYELVNCSRCGDQLGTIGGLDQKTHSVRMVRPRFGTDTLQELDH